MTLLEADVLKLPSTSQFLNSSCPGISHLDSNVHYSIEGEIDKLALHEGLNVDWPFNNHSLKSVSRVKLSLEYLNIARPPTPSNLDSERKEATAYVSLPFHIVNTFQQVLKYKEFNNRGNSHLQIGASVNPLGPDPFYHIHGTPGCLSSIIDIEEFKTVNNENMLNSHKNPLNKLSNNFSKILKLNTNNINFDESGYDSNLLSLTNGKAINGKAHTKSNILNKVEVESDSYTSRIIATNASKLLISCNVNVLNVIMIDKKSDYMNTQEVLSDTPAIPLAEDKKKESAKYLKVVEVPLMRLLFHDNMVATSIKAYTNLRSQPEVIVGFDSGQLFTLNLATLNYQVYQNCCSEHIYPLENDTKVCFNGLVKSAVTSLDVISQERYKILIIAGYSNGEVIIIDPRRYTNQTFLYRKRVVGADDYVTYFRTFNLSSFENPETPKEEPSWLVGHIKISHKAITSIDSTLRIERIKENDQRPLPMILAIGSFDGFVKLIDFTFTYDCDTSIADNNCRTSIITDIIGSYFQTSVTSVKFSPDYRYLLIGGAGDLIEIFQLNFFNPNYFFYRVANSNVNFGYERRPRSDTNTSAFSGDSGYQTNPGFQWNVSQDTTGRAPGTSNVKMTNYPSIIKDIRIVGRLMGHTNTIKRIDFVKDGEVKDRFQKSKPVYKIISCANDGKVMIWEFDHRALPRIRGQTLHSTNSIRNQGPQSMSPQPNLKKSRGSSSVTMKNKRRPSFPSRNAQTFHTRSKSFGQNDEATPPSALSPTFLLHSFSQLGHSFNKVANNTMSTMESVLHNQEEPIDISLDNKSIISHYKSLFEFRSRKFYSSLLADRSGVLKGKKKYSSIIYPIVSDRLVPSITVPLLVLDLSKFVRDGNIDGFYIDFHAFWCFGKNGDIFKYNIFK